MPAIVDRIVHELQTGRLDLDQLIVTRGEDGAEIWTRDENLSGRPPTRTEVVDTVGAGDAFSAVWILGLVRRWAPETTMMRALEFAAVVCGWRGATSDDLAVYRKLPWDRTGVHCNVVGDGVVADKSKIELLATGYTEPQEKGV